MSEAKSRPGATARMVVWVAAAARVLYLLVHHLTHALLASPRQDHQSVAFMLKHFETRVTRADTLGVVRFLDKNSLFHSNDRHL